MAANIDGACAEMIRAKTVCKNNISGTPGVDWRILRGLRRAASCFKGRRYYLGAG